mgnify:CR=1 FL=1
MLRIYLAEAAAELLRLWRTPQAQACLELVDDGCGFEPGRVAPGHYGLVGLHEQAEAIGAGQFRVIDEPRVLELQSMARALNRMSGVTGHDEDQNGKLRTIEFPRIKGGKHFDIDQPWFGNVMASIGQTYKPA